MDRRLANNVILNRNHFNWTDSMAFKSVAQSILYAVNIFSYYDCNGMSLYPVLKSYFRHKRNYCVAKGLGCFFCKYYDFSKCTHKEGAAIYMYYTDREYLDTTNIRCKYERLMNDKPFILNDGWQVVPTDEDR